MGHVAWNKIDDDDDDKYFKLGFQDDQTMDDNRPWKGRGVRV